MNASSPSNAGNSTTSDPHHNQTTSSMVNDPKKKSAGAVNDFMAKGGQLFSSIQGSIDKGFGQIAEAVHFPSSDNPEGMSVIPSVQLSEFEPYLLSVKEHWSEYNGIVSSLAIVRDPSVTPTEDEPGNEGVVINAFREIPQVFFNTDYKQSGFEQHQIFTQPLRVSVQNQGKINAQLSAYLRAIESHLVKHLSNVDSLLRSLMTIATIQSDIAIAHDRVVGARKVLTSIRSGEIAAGLNLHRLARRKARIQSVLSVLEHVEKASQAKPSVDELVRQGDFATAMELIQATQMILSTKLGGLLMTDRIRTVIAEHGRNIDGVLEAEFSELVIKAVFEGSGGDSKKLISTTQSMAERSLLIPCIQIQLKEAISKRLRSQVRAESEVGSILGCLVACLGNLASFLVQVDAHTHYADLNITQIQRLTSLRLFEAIAAVGLARTSQCVTESLDSPAALAVSHEIDIFSILKISDFSKTRAIMSFFSKQIEALYVEVFGTKLCLFEHLSFGSSILGASAQNGFSPDVDLTLAAIARGRLCRFTEAAVECMQSLLEEERWDKPAVPSPEVIRVVGILDDDGVFGGVKVLDSPDSSPTSVVRVVRMNKVNFLLVPVGLTAVEVAGEYSQLSVAVPGVAVECLTRLTSIFRLINKHVREQVLDGKMAGKSKKAINATNLSLASQVVGMLAQLAALVGKLFSRHFNVLDTGLLVFEPSEPPHDILLDDPRPAITDLVQQLVMELNEHRMEIFFKLSDILISRFDFHLKRWVAIEPAPPADGTPMEGIVKDFSQMYKVLIKSLQTDNLKRVFARAFNESCHKFREKVGELTSSATTPPKLLAEYACRFRIDLLFLYQNMLVGETMGGLKSSLSSMVEEILEVIEAKLPLIDKSLAAESAVEKLKTLLRQDDA